MKPLLFALCVVFACDSLSAQTPAWQPSPGHTQVPIWPGAAPDAQPAAGPEVSRWWPAGRGGFTLGNVSQPTMTVYSPEGKNTGAAVVVFPGGGYEDLAIDLEGTEVCDWLTPKGITCVLLKYRVPGEGLYPKSAPYPKSGPYPESPMALEDAQRTMGLVRFHAAEWHIDPHKIGVLGFSAGGHLSAAMSTYFDKRLYPAVDAADKESCRPDFAVVIYPGHLSIAAAEWDAKQGTKKYAVRYPANADKDLGDRQHGISPGHGRRRSGPLRPPLVPLPGRSARRAERLSSAGCCISAPNTSVAVRPRERSGARKHQTPWAC